MEEKKIKLKIFVTFFVLFVLFVQWGSWRERANLNLTKNIVERNSLNIDYNFRNTGDRAYYQSHYYSSASPGEAILSTPFYFTVDSFLQIKDYRNHTKYNLDLVNSSRSKRLGYLVNKENIYTVIQEVETDTFNLSKYMRDNPFEPSLSGENSSEDFINSRILLIPSVSDAGDIIFELTLLVFFPALFGALLLVGIYSITGFFSSDQRSRIFVTFIAGLGTSILNYSTVWESNITGTFLTVLSLYLIFKAVKREKRSYYFFLGGLLAGFSCFVLYEAFLFFIPLSFYIYSKKGKKAIMKVFFGFFIGISPFLIYNFINFGNPFSISTFHTDKLMFFESSHFREIEGLGGTLSEKTYLTFRTFLGVTIYPYTGIFFFHPIILASLLGVFYFRRRYPDLWQLSISTTLLYIFYQVIILSNPSGYASYGNKYFLPAIPILAISLISIIGRKLDWKKLIFYFIVFISVFHALLGLNPWTEWTENVGVEKYLHSMSDFQPVGNPIYDYYLGEFMEYGPTSKIFEQAIRFKFPPTLRWTYPRYKFFTGNSQINFNLLLSLIEILLPFLPFFVLFFILWRREILLFFKKMRF